MNARTEPIEESSMFGGPFIMFEGEEINIETLDTGYIVTAQTVIKDKDGDRVKRVSKRYAISDKDKLKAAVSFWVEKQEQKR